MAEPILPTGVRITYHQEYRRCNKPGCTQCRAGPGHGPYWFAQWRIGGRSRKRYLGRTVPAGVDAAPLNGASRTATATPPARLRVQTLGGFAVWRDGEPIPDAAWRRRKAGALLACLLAAPDLRLSRAQAIALLWPEPAPPAETRDLDAVRARDLRGSLHQLRRLLDGPAAVAGRSSAIQNAGALLLLAVRDDRASGGALRAPDEWLDAAAFRQVATHALAGADPSACHVALALYTGDYLPHDTAMDDEWEQPWIARQRKELRDLSLHLQLHLANLAVAAGAAEVAMEHWRAVLRLEPAHEEASRQLMELLTTQGRRGDALRVYQALAAALERELGAAPSQDLVALRSRLVAQEAVPVTAPAPHPAPRPPAPAPRPAPLPAAPTRFVGRAWDQAEVRRLLTEAPAASRLLTLTGAPGCGKTRLALAVAVGLLPAYPDGVGFAELAALSDPALVPVAVARALALREEPGRSLLATLAAALASRRLLLVLDNCEHLAAACAALAAALLDAAPGVTILATSRVPLGIEGATVWVTPPLAVPPEGSTVPAELRRYDAARLFVQRAQAAQPGFHLDEETAGAVAAICRRLDGLPLALELAAARLSNLTLPQVVDRLDRRFHLAVSGGRAVPPHHRTLRATLDWSYNLLTEGERVLLLRVAVFAGGWTGEAAEAVCAGAPLPAAAVPDRLDALVRQSLVQAEGMEGATRYRLLETVRQYAGERLRESAEDAAVRDRHLDWCLALAEAAEPELTGPRHARWMARLEGEHDNIRAALHWALTSGAIGGGLRLAAALWRFWEVRGHLSEGRAWLEGLLAREDDGPPRGADAERAVVRANALRGAGALAYRQGDYECATAHHAQSLALWRGLGDTRGIAGALNNLAIAAHDQGQHERARALLEESLALKRALGDTHGIASALTNLGLVLHSQGDADRARALHEESLAVYRALGDAGGVAVTLSNLGEIARMQGDVERAAALYSENLVVLRPVGHKVAVAACLEGVADVAHARGQPERATQLLAAAQALWDSVGAPPTPAERLVHERYLRDARAALGDARFHDAHTRGYALTMEQAIALALSGDD